MTRARERAPLFVGTGLIAGLALALASRHSDRAPLPPRSPENRPTLLLLTSLPLVFGDEFSVERNGSPVLKALEERYRVVPISVTDPPELTKGRLLLMAQPLAQPAEDLVALDTWVRRGGRVLLLADPMLEWPSNRALGDPLRPPSMFMDTGLLAHWGLRLDSPEQRGPVRRKLGEYQVTTVSPGMLAGRCDIDAGGLIARCRIGRGRAIVVGDADLLDTVRLGSDAQDNVEAIIKELAHLEQP